MATLGPQFEQTAMPTHVLINQGIPELVDGHHRTAEWRGRGRSEFPARVLNLDQLGPHVRKQFARANNPRRNDEI